MRQKMIKNDFWKEYKITEDEVLCFDFQTIRIWCVKKESELLVSYRMLDNNNEEELLFTEAHEDLTWSRCAVEREKITIRVLPVFPNRSVMVKPELSFRMAEGAKVRIYIRVPIWIRIELVAKSPETILDFFWSKDKN